MHASPFSSSIVGEMPWMWCNRRLRVRYQVWWEHLETLESERIVGTFTHLTWLGAAADLARLPPQVGRNYRRLIVEVSYIEQEFEPE